MVSSQSALPSSLVAADDEPWFAKPWQAQALAIADSLMANGVFSASIWSETLGQTLEQSKAQGNADDQENYYRCVLTALEALLAKRASIDLGDLDEVCRTLGIESDTHGRASEAH